MATPVSADLRWLRAGVVALVAAGLGTYAHVTAGGRLPSAPEVVLLLAVLVAASALALGSPAGYGRLTLLVGAGQALMHVALTMTTGPGTGATHHHHHHHGTAGPGSYEAGGTSGLDLVVEHVASDVSGAHLAMTLAHLAAAAGVAAWLATGEHALWALVALLGIRAVRQVLRAVALVSVGPPHLAPVAAAQDAADERPARARRFAAAGPTGRRGPPVALLATSPAT